ncbi:Nucleoside-diphosphate-sugar epimerase [Lachnospiraceae bacterium NE2001]|nr:Nucleoside-diphosphate-sugar epimerase [Lachnospiraceae bacterium NE2001]
MNSEYRIENVIKGRFFEDILEITEDDIDWGRLAGKCVLITGAAGFIAYHLVIAMLLWNDINAYTDGENDMNSQNGSSIRVVGMVRSLERAKAKYGALTGREDFILVEQDVCDTFNIEGRVDYVIHAASQASAWHFENDPVGTIKANLVGTTNALEFARRQDDELSNKTTTLIVSSLKTYGNVTDGSHELLEETQGYMDIDSYKNCYAMGKRASETLAASYAKQYGMNIKIVRPSYIYGAASLDDDRVWAQFIANVVRGENILLKSAGAPYRSFCYVTDTARAIFRVLLEGEEMQPYNISSKLGNVTIRDFARKAVEAFPEKELSLSFANPEDRAEPVVDYTKQTPEIMNSDRLEGLGWNAKVDITEGIKRAVAILTEK